jgi:hypothetical protein
MIANGRCGRIPDADGSRGECLFRVDLRHSQSDAPCQIESRFAPVIQSGFAPEAFTTFDHFAISDLT